MKFNLKKIDKLAIKKDSKKPLISKKHASKRDQSTSGKKAIKNRQFGNTFLVLPPQYF
jgi:hypothetical protein